MDSERRREIAQRGGKARRNKRVQGAASYRDPSMAATDAGRHMSKDAASTASNKGRCE